MRNSKYRFSILHMIYVVTMICAGFAIADLTGLLVSIFILSMWGIVFRQPNDKTYGIVLTYATIVLAFMILLIAFVFLSRDDGSRLLAHFLYVILLLVAPVKYWQQFAKSRSQPDQDV